MTESDVPNSPTAPAGLWVRVHGFADHILETTIASRVGGGLHLGLLTALAALAAYLPTHLIGLKQGFWSAMTAIAVVQTEFHSAETTARDQFAGAVIGGTIAVVMLLLLGDHLLVYASAIVLAAVICWVINLPTATRLSATTCTIIILVPRTGAPEFTMFARLSEVAWGVCVAVFIVWIAARAPKKSIDAKRAKASEVK